MNKLLQSIKAGEIRLRKLIIDLDDTHTDLTPDAPIKGDIYFDGIEIEQAIRSNTIKLLEEQILWLEGQKWTAESNSISKMQLYTMGLEHTQGMVQGRNDSLDEIISMLRGVIKELKTN